MFHILVLGEKNSGKTSLIEKLLNYYPQAYSCSIENKATKNKGSQISTTYVLKSQVNVWKAKITEARYPETSIYDICYMNDGSLSEFKAIFFTISSSSEKMIEKQIKSALSAIQSKLIDNKSLCFLVFNDKVLWIDTTALPIQSIVLSKMNSFRIEELWTLFFKEHRNMILAKKA